MTITITSEPFPWVDLWQRVLVPEFAGRPCRAMEVGSREGRSAVWMLEHVLPHPDSSLVCVDLWRKPAVEARFDANVKEFGWAGKLTKRKGDSKEELMNHVPAQFDLIYIDGGHDFQSVLLDSALAWPLLKRRGIMVWDDYGHRKLPEVREAVEVFTRGWGREFCTLHEKGQFIVRKQP